MNSIQVRKPNSKTEVESEKSGKSSGQRLNNAINSLTMSLINIACVSAMRICIFYACRPYDEPIHGFQ